MLGNKVGKALSYAKKSPMRVGDFLCNCVIVLLGQNPLPEKEEKRLRQGFTNPALASKDIFG